MDLKAETTVSEVDHRGAGILLDDVLLVFVQGRQMDMLGIPGHRHGFPGANVEIFLVRLGARIEGLLTLFQHIQDPFRHVGAVFGHAFDRFRHANGVPSLERSEFPIEAPTHCAVDIHDIVGNLAQTTGGICQRFGSYLPGKLAGTVVGVDQKLQPFADVFDLLGRAQRIDTDLLLRSILKGLGIQYLDLLALFFVEAGPGFLAGSTTCHQLVDPIRHEEGISLFVVR